MSNLRKRIYAGKGSDDESDKSSKKRRSYNPIHHHMGPFNTVDKEAPVDPIDRIGWKHDVQYGNAQVNTGSVWQPYIYTGKADEEFVREGLESHTLAGAAYAIPFIVKNAIMPRLPDNVFDPPVIQENVTPVQFLGNIDEPQAMLDVADSFGKSTMNRYNGRRNKRRSGKKRRRSSKPMKRLSKLAIYKTIGKTVDQRIATYANVVGAFNTENPMTTLSSNNEYLVHACTLNDFFQYQDMANSNAGASGGEDMDVNYLAFNYDGYYMTKCIAQLELSSFCNVDLVLQPIKITLKNDLPNDHNSTIVDENLAAYNVFSQLKYLASMTVDPSDYTLISDPVLPLAANYLPTSMQWPSGMQLPWKTWKQCFDIQIGREFILPAGSSAPKITCKGKKGFMPKEQFWRSAPSSGVGSLTSPRQVVGFAKKTSIFCFRVRQKSHVYSSKFAGTDIREAYLGGPFRFVMNILKQTSAVNMPTTAQSQHHTTFRDSRPQADNTTTVATALAWADTDVVAGAVVVTA